MANTLFIRQSPYCLNIHHEPQQIRDRIAQLLIILAFNEGIYNSGGDSPYRMIFILIEQLMCDALTPWIISAAIYPVIWEIVSQNWHEIDVIYLRFMTLEEFIWHGKYFLHLIAAEASVVIMKNCHIRIYDSILCMEDIHPSD